MRTGVWTLTSTFLPILPSPTTTHTLHIFTTIKIAMLSGNTQVAQVLIQHGANLNLTDADGKTALMVGVCVSMCMGVHALGH